MLDFVTIERKLQSALSLERYIHTMGVVKTALKMADFYGADKKKVHAAALLHDCVKDYPADMKRRFCKEFHVPVDEIMLSSIDLTHPFLGAEVAKREYGVDDDEILNAIKYHTTGRKNMTLIEKIIFLADYIEPNRKDFKGLNEVRQMCFENIDAAMKMAICQTVEYVRERGRVLHPLSLEALEYYKNGEE
ncbi:MAG: HD domain-containing protein [Firmicutes bacterium]|nr:HD domain-containing protein [Bacillota bacterium]